MIASVTGANLVLAVAEPTLSGLHHLERVVALTRHFGIPTLVCVNKWDLNAGLTPSRSAVHPALKHRDRLTGATDAVRGVYYLGDESVLAMDRMP